MYKRIRYSSIGNDNNNGENAANDAEAPKSKQKKPKILTADNNENLRSDDAASSSLIETGDDNIDGPSGSAEQDLF